MTLQQNENVLITVIILIPTHMPGKKQANVKLHAGKLCDLEGKNKEIHCMPSHSEGKSALLEGHLAQYAGK